MDITPELRRQAADTERAELRDQAHRQYAQRVADASRILREELDHIDNVHAMRTA